METTGQLENQLLPLVYHAECTGVEALQLGHLPHHLFRGVLPQSLWDNSQAFPCCLLKRQCSQVHFHHAEVPPCPLLNLSPSSLKPSYPIFQSVTSHTIRPQAAPSLVASIYTAMQGDVEGCPMISKGLREKQLVLWH